MALFLFKPFLKFRYPKLKPHIFDELAEARPFEEVQREEALVQLADFFKTWQTSWEKTKSSLGIPPLSESAKNSLSLYESDQKNSVITLLSAVLVAWDSDNSPEFAKSIVALARELRPSLPYIEFDPDEHFCLSSAQLLILRHFIESNGEKLKEIVASLSKLSVEKISFTSTSPLTIEKAEALLREHLDLPYFNFLDFAFDSDTEIINDDDTSSFPALLAASAEFNL